jgi:hypothetical protein
MYAAAVHHACTCNREKAGSDVVEGTAVALWCRWCGKRVRLAGDGEPEMRKAVHSASGRETGEDGHIAAPQDSEPPLWKAARELEAEFGGAFRISARFGFLRADWADVVTPEHFEAADADEMRPRLKAALAAAVP